jgi:uncharacterized membrane protein YfcA
MILLGLLIGAVVGFYRFAKDHNLSNKWLWALLPVLSYFIFAFTIGFCLGVFAPHLITQAFLMAMIELVSAGVGIGLAYLVMLRATRQRKHNQLEEEVLDV